MEELSLSLRGLGTAQAGVAEIAALRKAIPAWAPPDTPGHFLKHADEQTVLAVAAVDRAIESAELTTEALREWAIVAAPRFIGRIAGVATLGRFSRGGGPAISPHVIPQHSLHSVSGALSILLSSRHSNLGVGGTGNSLAEALFAGLTFPGPQRAGVWLVCTAWDPEPQIDDKAECTNEPVCHAVALALAAEASASDHGRLRFAAGLGLLALSEQHGTTLNTAALCRSLSALDAGRAARFGWNLANLGQITLDVRVRTAALAKAA